MTETALLAGTLLAVLRLEGVEWPSVGLYWVGLGPFLLHTAVGALLLTAPDLVGLVLRIAKRQLPTTDSNAGRKETRLPRAIVAFAPVCLASAFWEELCFRGMVLHFAPDGFFWGGAMALISSAVFGLHHLRQGPPAAILTSCFGLVLYLHYVWMKDLPATMMAHVISNGCVVFWFAPRIKANATERIAVR